MGLFGLTHMAPTTIQPGGQKPGCKRARILLRVGLPRVGTLGLLALTRRRAGGCPVVARKGFSLPDMCALCETKSTDEEGHQRCPLRDHAGEVPR
eukprot:15247364-Heterocapsa_arctica.AAC.1